MKKIACSIAAIAFVATAFADVLLWQVPTSPVSGSDPGGYTGGTGSIAWDYAMLNYTTTTYSELNYGNVGEVDSGASTPTMYYQNNDLLAADSSLAGKTVGSEYGDGSSYSSGSWYIGLYNSAGNLVGFSQLMSNEDVQQFRAASRNISDWAGVNAIPAGSGGWTAAPEPTSGVLLLLGAAVLGLRRRKVA